MRGRGSSKEVYSMMLESGVNNTTDAFLVEESPEDTWTTVLDDVLGISRKRLGKYRS